VVKGFLGGFVTHHSDRIYLHHYKWAELKDFKGGMWTVGDWVIPPNGAALMQDCYPLPQGGIRAFGKFSIKSNAGISIGEYPNGAYVRGGIANRSRPTTSADYYLSTWNPNDLTPRLYRFDESADATGWSLIKSFAQATNVSGVSGWCWFVTYYSLDQTTGNTTPYVVLSQDYLGSESGLWKVVYADGSVARLSTTQSSNFAGPITVHDGRLIVNATQNSSRIWFTEPNIETINNPNFIDLNPYQGKNPSNAWLHSFAPSDLLVGKVAAPFVFVQGSLDPQDQPTVRTMAEVRASGDRQGVVEMERGIAFMAPQDGIYRTPDGAYFEKLSDALSTNDLFGGAIRGGNGKIASWGQLCYLDNWLFTPSGHVYDVRTKAWFKHTAWNSAQPARGIVSVTDPDVENARSIVAFQDPVDTFSTLNVLQLKIEEGNDQMPRVEQYTFRTLPFNDETGRQVEIGEVHTVLKSYTTNSSVDVTVNGNTRSFTNIGTGKVVVPVLFRERNTVLDVTVTPKSNTTGIEAPSIESIRIGFLSGHLLRVQ
jgi:hypothetical protein